MTPPEGRPEGMAAPETPEEIAREIARPWPIYPSMEKQVIADIAAALKARGEEERAKSPESPEALVCSLLEVPCPSCREAAPSFTVTFVGDRGEKGVMVSCNDCGRTKEASLAAAPSGDDTCPEEGCTLQVGHKEPCDTELPDAAPSGDARRCKHGIRHPRECKDCLYEAPSGDAKEPAKPVCPECGGRGWPTALDSCATCHGDPLPAGDAKGTPATPDPESASLRERLRAVECATATIEQRAKDCAAEAVLAGRSDYEGHLRSRAEGYRRAAVLLRDALALSGSSAPQAAAMPEDAEGGSQKGTE